MKNQPEPSQNTGTVPLLVPLAMAIFLEPSVGRSLIGTDATFVTPTVRKRSNSVRVSVARRATSGPAFASTLKGMWNVPRHAS